MLSSSFYFTIMLDLTEIEQAESSLVLSNSILTSMFPFGSIASNSKHFPRLDDCTRAAMDFAVKIRDLLDEASKGEEFTVEVHQNPFVYDRDSVYEYDEEFLNLFDESTMIVITVLQEHAEYYACKMEICVANADLDDMYNEMMNQPMTSLTASNSIH